MHQRLLTMTMTVTVTVMMEMTTTMTMMVLPLRRQCVCRTTTSNLTDTIGHPCLCRRGICMRFSQRGGSTAMGGGVFQGEGRGGANQARAEVQGQGLVCGCRMYCHAWERQEPPPHGRVQAAVGCKPKVRVARRLRPEAGFFKQCLRGSPHTRGRVPHARRGRLAAALLPHVCPFFRNCAVSPHQRVPSREAALDVPVLSVLGGKGACVREETAIGDGLARFGSTRRGPWCGVQVYKCGWAIRTCAGSRDGWFPPLAKHLMALSLRSIEWDKALCVLYGAA